MVYKILLLDTSVGAWTDEISIHKANKLIIFEPDPGFAMENLILKKIWNVEQKQEIYVYRLFVSGSYEEQVILSFLPF